MVEPAFKLHDAVEYRWSAEGPFVGKARIVEILSDGRYRLERLDGTSFPREGSIFAEEQLPLRPPERSDQPADDGLAAR